MLATAALRRRSSLATIAPPRGRPGAQRRQRHRWRGQIQARRWRCASAAGGIHRKSPRKSPIFLERRAARFPAPVNFGIPRADSTWQQRAGSAVSLRPHRWGGVRDSPATARRAALGRGEIRPWWRILAAIAPFSDAFSAGRVEASMVAGVLLVAIVAIVLFLFGRGVFAHEAQDAASPGSSAPLRRAQPPLAMSTAARIACWMAACSSPRPRSACSTCGRSSSRVSEVGRTLRMVGQVIADPGTSGEVHALIPGRLEPYRGVWPKVGQKVEAGEVLAWVVPVVNPIDRGIILQQVAQIDHEIGSGSRSACPVWRRRTARPRRASSMTPAPILAEPDPPARGPSAPSSATATPLAVRRCWRRAPGSSAASFAATGQVGRRAAEALHDRRPQAPVGGGIRL